MAARESILARIRANLHLPGAEPAAAEGAAIARHLSAHPHGPRPLADWPDPGARFLERAAALGSTVAEVVGQKAVPQAVLRYLESHGLHKSVVCWAEFAALDWRGQGIAAEARAARASDLIGVTGCFCGIAETGTLMFLSGVKTPAATSLLPETHIAVLPVERIVSGTEEAWNLLRAEQGKMPRAVNLISGPSRTADIEQTIVIGAHGPYRVHILLVR
jgi:L-lactate dehydrogenase complex protein LldG